MPANDVQNTVLCFPLQSLLLSLNKSHIDYFSLDADGFELGILDSIPFGQLDVDVISIESKSDRDTNNNASQRLYDKILSRHGYWGHTRVGLRDTNIVFVKGHLLRRLKHPNARDTGRSNNNAAGVVGEKNAEAKDNLPTNRKQRHRPHTAQSNNEQIQRRQREAGAHKIINSMIIDRENREIEDLDRGDDTGQHKLAYQFLIYDTNS